MTVENPPIDQTKKKDAPQLSRREFIVAGASMLAAAGGLLIYKEIRDRLDMPDSIDKQTLQGSFNNPPEVTTIENKQSRKSEEEQRLGILRNIESKYGIYTPSQEGEYTRYQACWGDDNIISCGKETKSAQITKDEASIIYEALGRFPSPGKYVQLVIPFRYASGEGGIGGGHMSGFNWEYFLDPAKYQEYPKDRYLSTKSAAELDLIDKKPDEALPSITEQSNFLPLLSEAYMNEVEIKPKNRVDYPWTTIGKRLRQVVVHEIGGHGVTEYATGIKVNHNPRAENNASTM